MKSILYIVAIIAILAGAWFSYESKSKFEELQAQRKELDVKNENRKASIKTARREGKVKLGKIAAARSKLSEAKAALDLEKSSKLNPLKKKGMQIADLTSTHPPISERIGILRGMMHGVSFADYQTSYSKIAKKKDTIIPKSELKKNINIPILSQIEKLTKLGKKEEQRKLGDIVMAVNDYSFLNCSCGLKLKAPADFKGKEVSCPKCGERLKFE